MNEMNEISKRKPTPTIEKMTAALSRHQEADFDLEHFKGFFEVCEMFGDKEGFADMAQKYPRLFLAIYDEKEWHEYVREVYCFLRDSKINAFKG